MNEKYIKSNLFHYRGKKTFQDSAILGLLHFICILIENFNFQIHPKISRYLHFFKSAFYLKKDKNLDDITSMRTNLDVTSQY
ncbi:hypothetical protein BpHYR1_052077 [Brachionus plicatilis]|uniref:Uncharacterized protein n=1 Tax=Brachionus plicatilis TaxID=10195 RepID=A0A3M7R9C2_BRAPC|nr:hypothetical protein BpHYR1_052077 [Brachionus plicatilis]